MLPAPRIRKLKHTLATPEHSNMSNQATSSSSKLHAPRAEIIDLTIAHWAAAIDLTNSGGTELIDLTDDHSDQDWIGCDAEDPFAFKLPSHTTAAIRSGLHTLSPTVASGSMTLSSTFSSPSTAAQVLDISLLQDTLLRLIHFKKPTASVLSNGLAHRNVAELELSGLLLLPNPSSSGASHAAVSMLSKRRLWLKQQKKDAKRRKFVHESAFMQGVEPVEVFD